MVEWVSRQFTGGRCAHCGGPQVGMGSIGPADDFRLLCRPDYGLGMDCYHLVVVDGHGMPCDCRGKTANPEHDRCYQCQYRRFEHSVDPDLPQRFDFLGDPVPCDEFLEPPASFSFNRAQE